MRGSGSQAQSSEKVKENKYSKMGLYMKVGSKKIKQKEEVD